VRLLTVVGDDVEEVWVKVHASIARSKLTMDENAAGQKTETDTQKKKL
jgi:hypothetical protein